MKVVITGAESSGKTTLFNSLEDFYNIKGAKEYAREYLSKIDREYFKSDLCSIAQGQIKYEFDAKDSFPNLVLCDSDVLTIKIWSNYKYGDCDKEILELLSSFPADLYLLLSPDIPWEDDPLRENPNNREELFALYKMEIEQLKIPYFIISGDKQNRLDSAISIIDNFISNK